MIPKLVLKALTKVATNPEIRRRVIAAAGNPEIRRRVMAAANNPEIREQVMAVAGKGVESLRRWVEKAKPSTPAEKRGKTG